MISFPIRVRWKDENGKEVIQEGLTENVGPNGTLIYLPRARALPLVGGKVHLTVTENPQRRGVGHRRGHPARTQRRTPASRSPLDHNLREWKKKVWQVAGETIAALEPEELDDW